MISPTPVRTSLTSNCPQDTFHTQGPSRSNPTVCSRLIFTPQRYTLYFNQQVSSQELCQFGMHGCLCMCMCAHTHVFYSIIFPTISEAPYLSQEGAYNSAMLCVNLMDLEMSFFRSSSLSSLRLHLDYPRLDNRPDSTFSLARDR